MEIYKLSDDVPGTKPRRKKSSVKSGVEGAADFTGDSGIDDLLKITDLRQGVKNPERVNVFINGKFVFSLDVVQVIDYKVKVGRELSDAEFEELRKASEFGKLYQRTVEWLLMRPRSTREARDYLTRKVRQSSSEIVPEVSEQVFSRLLEKGYLDDWKFAQYYVDHRFVKKGISKKRLRMELMKKGVAKEIIDGVLSKRDDEEEIRKMMARKRDKYDDEKLKAYLVRQGFSYDLVRKVVEESDSEA